MAEGEEGDAAAAARCHRGGAGHHLGQLASTASKLETGREFFLAALKLLSDPQAFYERGGTSLRRAMNAVIFGKLYVTDGEITAHELAEMAETLVEAGQRATPTTVAAGR